MITDEGEEKCLTYWSSFLKMTMRNGDPEIISMKRREMYLFP